MKKIVLALFVLSIVIGTISPSKLEAAVQVITPRAPKVTEGLKPIIVKYKQGNYVSALQELDELLAKEPENTYAKYYQALCYTKLGYREEARAAYNEVITKNDNLTLVYYSTRANTCLDNPASEICNPPKATPYEEAQMDELERFIESGQKIHPSAMDRITRERMERKLQAEDYRKKQQEQNLSYNFNSRPTDEEIIAAVNTLSKVGLAPMNQNIYNLANANMGLYPMNGFYPMNAMQGDLNYNGNDTDVMSTLLLNQLNTSLLRQNNNSFTNYGI